MLLVSSCTKLMSLFWKILPKGSNPWMELSCWKLSYSKWWWSYHLLEMFYIIRFPIYFCCWFWNFKHLCQAVRHTPNYLKVMQCWLIHWFRPFSISNLFVSRWWFQTLKWSFACGLQPYFWVCRLVSYKLDLMALKL